MLVRFPVVVVKAAADPERTIWVLSAEVAMALPLALAARAALNEVRLPVVAAVLSKAPANLI